MDQPDPRRTLQEEERGIVMCGYGRTIVWDPTGRVTDIQ